MHGDDRDPGFNPALSDWREDVCLGNRFRRETLGDGGKEPVARLVVLRHRVAAAAAAAGFLRASSSRSTYSLRMCMKSCAFVTTPNAWWVPRSLSLLTTNSEESTQIVASSRIDPSLSVTNAGSMLPVAIACNAVRSEEHTSELQSQSNLVCRLLLEKKKNIHNIHKLDLQLN